MIVPDSPATPGKCTIMFLRNSAKALILESGNLLVLRKRGGDTYYVLPGGGQNPGETLHEALRRECSEELGADVEVGPLVYIREYIARNHEFAEEHPDLHQIEFVYRCILLSPIAGEPTQPDDSQEGYQWIPIERIRDYPFYPQRVKTLLSEAGYQGPVYLGDVN